MLEPQEVAAHPQHAARGLFVSGAANQAGAHLDFLRTQPALVKTGELPTERAPAQGEHTAAVLRDWQID